MSYRGYNCLSKMAIVGLIATAALALTVPAAPASAQGFLEFLFGGARRPAPPPPPVAFDSPSDMFRSLFERGGGRQESVQSSGGPHRGYCVRLCDGRYFPVQGTRNASAAAQCNAFCPASATKIFSGSEIDHAVAPDGRRYADLPNAFVYRKRIVPGCTCDGKSPVGVAHVPVTDDPTLRPGDVVATNSGFTVYNGRDPQRQTAFTPLDSAKVSKSLRNQLADVKVTPKPAAADAAPATILRDETSSIAADRRHFIARAQ